MIKNITLFYFVILILLAFSCKKNTTPLTPPNIWFADSFLAIDQGPQIVMIENFRTGLLWNLFMSCPEVKRGMKNLRFQSPNL